MAMSEYRRSTLRFGSENLAVDANRRVGRVVSGQKYGPSPRNFLFPHLPLFISTENLIWMALARAMKKTKRQMFPTSWSKKRVRQVIDHYERQTEDEQAAEIEARLKEEGVTMIAVPNELVPKVYAILATQPGA